MNINSGEQALLKSRFPTDLPVTGAWRPGDDPGQRRFAVIAEPDKPFALEGGGRLTEVRVAYQTWGKLNAAASNAVLVCHALTGDSHAAGDSGPGHSTPGWWSDMIGPGRAIDTDRYFVVCSNVLGGCQGTTGPADMPPSPEFAQPAGPGTRAGRSELRGPRPYGPRFPTVTVRDMVRVQARLAVLLCVRRWLTVLGGSMGGMQALEWAAMYPRRVRSVMPLATCAAASAQQIAWSAVGRLAIACDPSWNGGDYYHLRSGPWRGLTVARELAQVTYRSAALFDRSFGRDPFDPEHLYQLWGRYQVESYLDHHGQKLVRRFDANSYLLLNKAMDMHDIGRGRGGAAAALRRIKVPMLTASISSDTLYPPYQQHEIRDAVTYAGGDCRLVMLDSDKGHDGFLLEHDLLQEPVSDFLDEMSRKNCGTS